MKSKSEESTDERKQLVGRGAWMEEGGLACRKWQAVIMSSGAGVAISPGPDGNTTPLYLDLQSSRSMISPGDIHQ